jgi:signal transduction histidine kinase
VKFAKPGEQPRIDIFAVKKGNRLRISVLDHGIGIDPGASERIFGLFERGGTSVQGTGIGLAIVKKGVERMKGEVGLVSVRGQKTEFWIELNVLP